MSVLDYGDITYMHVSAWLYSVEQGSGTYGSQARRGSFDDRIWLTEKP